LGAGRKGGDLVEGMAANVPLLEELTSQLEEKGTFQQDLTSEELAVVMRSVFEGLVNEQKGVKADIADMSVQIEGEQGRFSGAVRVEKPLDVTIGGDCLLTNDETPGRLRLVSLDVREEAGFVAKVALKAVNVRGIIEKTLSDPNGALELALARQLESRGVKLTAVELQFGDDALSVLLRGEPIPTA
jgi:hypothetical protein